MLACRLNCLMSICKEKSSFNILRSHINNLPIPNRSGHVCFSSISGHNDDDNNTNNNNNNNSTSTTAPTMSQILNDNIKSKNAAKISSKNKKNAAKFQKTSTTAAFSDMKIRSSVKNETKTIISDESTVVAQVEQNIKKPAAPSMKTLKEAQEDVERRRTEPAPTEEEKILGKEIVDAASNLGQILGQSRGNTDDIKSTLIQKLLEIERETFDASKPASCSPSQSASVADNSTPPSSQLSSTLTSMKIVSTPSPTEADEKARLVDFVEQPLAETRKFLANMGFGRHHRDQKRMTGPTRTKVSSDEKITYEYVDFMTGERLNLFDDHNKDQSLISKDQEKSEKVELGKLPGATFVLLPEWERLQKRHVSWLADAAPRNGFEEMIEWTAKGKMYPYPIDNEYGFFEKLVPFSEHVFLSKKLLSPKDPRVPKSGPVRQFLDLVVHGLSKNPYMTLERKYEHVEWYKEYFKDKCADLERIKQNEDSLVDS